MILGSIKSSRINITASLVLDQLLFMFWISVAFCYDCPHQGGSECKMYMQISSGSTWANLLGLHKRQADKTECMAAGGSNYLSVGEVQFAVNAHTDRGSNEIRVSSTSACKRGTYCREICFYISTTSPGCYGCTGNYEVDVIVKQYTKGEILNLLADEL